MFLFLFFCKIKLTHQWLNFGSTRLHNVTVFAPLWHLSTKEQDEQTIRFRLDKFKMTCLGHCPCLLNCDWEPLDEIKIIWCWPVPCDLLPGRCDVFSDTGSHPSAMCADMCSNSREQETSFCCINQDARQVKTKPILCNFDSSPHVYIL